MAFFVPLCLKKKKTKKEIARDMQEVLLILFLQVYNLGTLQNRFPISEILVIADNFRTI